MWAKNVIVLQDSCLISLPPNKLNMWVLNLFQRKEHYDLVKWHLTQSFSLRNLSTVILKSFSKPTSSMLVKKTIPFWQERSYRMLSSLMQILIPTLLSWVENLLKKKKVELKMMHRCCIWTELDLVSSHRQQKYKLEHFASNETFAPRQSSNKYFLRNNP